MPPSPIEKAWEAYALSESHEGALCFAKDFYAGFSAALDALTSDKASEAAAKGIRRLGDIKGTDRSWDEHTTEFKREIYRKWGRAALAAARETLTDG